MTINDLIATSGHIAYENGKRYERNRVTRIAKEIAVAYQPELASEYQDVVFVSDLLEYLNDEDYK